MKPVVPITRLALLLALLPAPARSAARATAPPGPTPPLAAPFAQARLVTLKNGMQLLLAPDPGATAVDVAVWSRGGAAQERDGQFGIARLFERLMLAGAPDHGRRIAEAGGQAGAYSTADLACAYETVPPGALDLALELEAGRIAALRLTPPVVADAARAAGDEARRQAESQPWTGALRSFYGLAWGQHPYHRPATDAADLARITPVDCAAYHAATYAPGALLVTVTGRFEPEAALAAAKRWLEPIPRRPVPAARRPLAAAEQKAPRRGWDRLDVPLDLVIAGWKTPGHAAPETPALALLARVLAAGPGQRLQRALVGDSIGCASVQAVFDVRRDGGLLYVMAVVKPGADTALVERALLAQVQRLTREPVSGEELDRARRQEEVGTLLGWQTARGCADALAGAQLVDGDWRVAGPRLERVRQLTAADLQQAAARVIVPAGQSVLWVSTTRPVAPAPGRRSRLGPLSPQGGR